MLNYPLTQYMFCAPDEGAAAVVMCRADIAHRYTDKPVYLRAVEVRTRSYGAFEVHTTFAPVEEDVSPHGVRGAGRVREGRASAPEDVDVIQLQDTDAGAEIIHMAEMRLLRRRRPGEAARRRRHRDRRLAAGQHRRRPDRQRRADRRVRACARSTSWCASCAAQAGDRQVPGEPKVGFAQLYGAPGTAGATILTA